MTNLEKGIEITGRTVKDLRENECVVNFGIHVSRCNEECSRCWDNEFEGMRVPEGYKEVQEVDGVFFSDKEIVICGEVSEDDESHNCDNMGCTSVSHVIFRANISNIKKTGGSKVENQ